MSTTRSASPLTTYVIAAVMCACVCPLPSVLAADPSPTDTAEEIPVVNAPDVMISATRTPTSIGNVNQSVTIVTEEQLQLQMAASSSRSLGQILPKLVPGMSQNDQSMDSGTTLKMRGRSIAILIDGVPQQSSPTTELDLAHIDPSAIERIEIVRGATAIYGNGATGGLINIITKKAGEGKPAFYTEVQGSGSLTRVLRGLSGTVVQGFQGKKDWFDYNIVGTFSQQGGSLIPKDLGPCRGPTRPVGLPIRRPTTFLASSAPPSASTGSSSPSIANIPGRTPTIWSIRASMRCRVRLRASFPVWRSTINRS